MPKDEYNLKRKREYYRIKKIIIQSIKIWNKNIGPTMITYQHDVCTVRWKSPVVEFLRFSCAAILHRALYGTRFSGARGAQKLQKRNFRGSRAQKLQKWSFWCSRAQPSYLTVPYRKNEIFWRTRCAETPKTELLRFPCAETPVVEFLRFLCAAILHRERGFLGHPVRRNSKNGVSEVSVRRNSSTGLFEVPVRSDTPPYLIGNEIFWRTRCAETPKTELLRFLVLCAETPVS